MKMISINGARGEGGGQILRTCTALSAVTGEKFRIENIRANRPNPGIRPQHLHAIDAVARLCDAKVDGLYIGSSKLEFNPGNLQGGRIKLNIGTAGSVTLLLQAIMIPAMFTKKAVKLRITGGTDVKWSPSIDYLRYVTLPVLKRFGYKANISLDRRGYYPRGGGIVEAEIEPIKGMEKINLTKQGKLLRVRGISHAHRNLKNAEVAKRQMESARSLLYNRLTDTDIRENIKIKEEYSDTLCYGSGITLWVKTENTILGSDHIGEKGKKSEAVGKEAAEDIIKEIDSNAALDKYMADQIIPYLALLGGCVRVSEITQHTKTNVDVATEFGFKIRIKGNTIQG